MKLRTMVVNLSGVFFIATSSLSAYAGTISFYGVIAEPTCAVHVTNYQPTLKDCKKQKSLKIRKPVAVNEMNESEMQNTTYHWQEVKTSELKKLKTAMVTVDYF